jgi:hypothetical protein
VPPTKRTPRVHEPDRLTPIEKYIEDSKRRDLEKPYDDPLPF